MIKLAKLFSKITTKNNVIGFSNIIHPQIYDRISKELMDTMIIYVSKKVPLSQLSKADIIPRYYKSFYRKKLRFKVKSVGVITAPPMMKDLSAEAYEVDRTKRQNPVTLGLSVGHRTITAGSLGMSFIEQSSGNKIWGSNAHVLTPDASLKPDQIKEKRIHQPGSYHHEPSEETLVGEYHWHKQIVDNLSECSIAKIAAKSLNVFSNLFRRSTKLLTVLSKASNKIDFAVYEAKLGVAHGCKLPNNIEFPGRFIGLLFAGSEQAGIICKAQNINAEGYESVIPNGKVKVGDKVFGSSFWGDYETIVEDTSMSIQVQYGNFIAVFEDLILIKNENVIKGGWSGSGWFLTN